MKNKAVISVVVIVVVALALAIGFYFLKQDKPVPEGTPAVEQNQIPSGSETSGKLITGDFSINLPAGWRQAAPPFVGVSAMAVNADEIINDPAAEKINFKSYLAVSYDTLQGKSMSEYLQTVKDELQKMISGVVFVNEQDTTINSRSARAMEVELTQQGIDFKILMVAIKGEGEDVWVMSFNTIKSSWDENKEAFSDIAKSFSLKI
ncbi:MAG: hypothetical protein V2A55_00605 [Candidatus Jorgensenbacteria bacterium]